LDKQEKGEVPVLTFRQVKETPTTAEIHELLGIDPNATELNVVYGNKPMAKNELALLTRSLNDIMFEFAAQIEVPEKDVAEGRALPTVTSSPEFEKAWPPLFRVHCSSTQPTDVLTATRYRNQWFYIEDTDIVSKRMFSFIMFLVTLAESTAGTSAAPLITVPVK
jgi:hypothetical protein